MELENATELEYTNWKHKNRSGSFEHEWGRETNPNKGVGYFAQRAQTLLDLGQLGN